MELPKGKLISVGGAEDKGTDLEQGFIQRNRLNFFELGILKRIVDETGGVEKRIEVITTASSIPAEVGANYTDAFGKIGSNNVGIIDIRSREDVNKPDYIERIKACDCVMFSGGDQLRLTSISTYDEDFDKGYTRQFDSTITDIDFNDRKTIYNKLTAVSRKDTIWDKK